RYGLLQQFKAYKGELYEPENIHPALSWKADKQFVVNSRDPDEWKIVERNTGKKSKAVDNLPASQPKIATVPAKRKLGADYSPPEQTIVTAKRLQLPGRVHVTHSSPAPLGFLWNSVDYSCPYDGVIPILFHAW
ncbi:hypothetical protein SCHPADRAFT_806073, partial [Schizopora paradoxa]